MKTYTDTICSSSDLRSINAMIRISCNQQFWRHFIYFWVNPAMCQACCPGSMQRLALLLTSGCSPRGKARAKREEKTGVSLAAHSCCMLAWLARLASLPWSFYLKLCKIPREMGQNMSRGVYQLGLHTASASHQRLGVTIMLMQW